MLWAVYQPSSVEVMLEIVKLRWTPMFSIQTIWNPENGHEGINVTFWGHEENEMFLTGMSGGSIYEGVYI